MPTSMGDAVIYLLDVWICSGSLHMMLNYLQKSLYFVKFFRRPILMVHMVDPKVALTVV